MRTTHPPVWVLLVAPWSGMRWAPGDAFPYNLFASLSFLTEAVSNSDCIAPNGNQIRQSWIWHHAKGSCCGLILCLFRHLLGVCGESHEYLGQDSRCPNQNLNWTPPSTCWKHCGFVAKQPWVLDLYSGKWWFRIPAGTPALWLILLEPSMQMPGIVVQILPFPSESFPNRHYLSP
jgi:hypothetical protein